MAGFVDLAKFPVNPNLVGSQPQAPSREAMAQLDQVMSDPEQMLQMNVARLRGNDLAMQNQIVRDFQILSPYEFRYHYGDAVANQMEALHAGMPEYTRLMGGERTNAQVLGDNLNNILTGFAGGIGDAATMVGGVLSPEVGEFLSNQTTRMREGMQSLQSQRQQRRRYLAELKNQLDRQDNINQYIRDRSEGKSALSAGLSYFGRGLVNGATNLLEDPIALQTGVAEGVGSLFAGGAIARGTSTVSRLAGLGRRSTASLMPLAIGAMEGGSAYSGAMQEVLRMSHEDLQANSPYYRELLERGVSPERARQRVAHRAATIAGTIQAPLGAATGSLVSRFEANPLGSRSLRDIVQNIVRETAEEGIQSFTGSLAQNLGVRQADENRMLIEGAGEETAQGAILGSLTAGAVQAPRLPAATMHSAATALRNRAQEIQRKNQEESGVTPADLQRASQTATENLAPVLDAVDTMVEAAPEEIRQNVGASTLRERIRRAITITEEDDRELGDELIGWLQNNDVGPLQNRLDLLTATAQAVLSDNISEGARLSAGLYILNEFEKQKKLFQEDIDEIKGALDQSSPEYQAINAYQGLLDSFRNVESISKALEWTEKQARVEIPTEGPVSPETVTHAVQAATTKPTAMTVPGIRNVLRQADEGTVQITPEQRRALQNSVDVIQIAEQAAELQKQTKSLADYETQEVREVAEDILTRGYQEVWGLSIEQHLARINQAHMDGDPEALFSAVHHFSNFALSQRNKAIAAIRSLESGQEERFNRLGAYNKPHPVKGRITIHRHNPNSMALGRRVIIEANMLAEQVNRLLDAHPEVGVTQRIPQVRLPQELFGEQSSSNQTTTKEKITLTKKSKYVNKDQKKSDKANKFIGRGSDNSSTEQYRKDWGELANVGEYTDNDTVFVSVEGNRKNRISFDRDEIKKAIDARVKFITDTAEDRNRPYNIGERELAEFLKENGYVEINGTGVWVFDKSSKIAGREEAFEVTDEWQPVPEGAILPSGVQVQMDMETGQQMVRRAPETTIETSPEQETTQETPPVEEPVKEETEATQPTLEERFPHLVRTKEGISRFLQAFRGTRVGRLLDFDESSVHDTYALEATELNALEAYTELGQELVKKLENRLNAFLNTPYNSKQPKGPTFRDRILNGEDVAGTVQGRATAIVENVNGQLRYNKTLLQTAVLASLHWFASSQNREAHLDRQDIADLTGLPLEEVSNTLVDLFQSGVGQTEASRSLAAQITEFWGLDADHSAPDSLVKGIPEGLAKEILMAMEEQGFFKTGQITLPNQKTFNQLYFDRNIDPEIRRLLKEMGPAKKILRDVAGARDLLYEPTYDKPPKEIAPTQLRNRAVKNTREQRRVIRAAQSYKHYFYRNSFDMQQAIGKEAWMELMGSIPDTENLPFNEEHRKSVEGKNRTISMAFDAMVEQVRELEAWAEKHNKSPEEVAKYYRFNYSRVGRLQMLGAVNPQSNKIARHVFLTSKTTLDLTDPESLDSLGFFMAIAQGLGEKVHKQTPQENAAKARAMTVEEGGKYAELVTELAEWLRKGKKGSLADWARKLRQVDPGITEHGIMSLLSAAEYMNARDLNDGVVLSRFVSYNYFEADGVTNGPANALMNLTTKISPAWIKTIQKAGIFIGFENRSMISQNNETDLYTEAGLNLAKLQSEFVETLPQDVREVHTALIRIMQSMGMKVVYKENDNGTLEVSIDRGIMKNPLMITIYGSGVNGIAGNVTDEILSRFYEAITEHLQSDRRHEPFGTGLVINGEPYGSEGFQRDLETLLNNRVEYKDGEWFLEKNQYPANIGTSLKNLKIDKNEYATLKNNIRKLFVDDMVAAIDQTVMGYVGEMAEAIQKATNAQSIVLHFMYRKELMKAMADRQINPEKYPGYRKGEFLSQKEMDEILQRLLPYGAVINTGHQSFFIGSGERGNLLSTVEIEINGKTYRVNMPENFSRALSNHYKTPAYAYAPKFAGVSGVPFFNIGTGDGRTIDVFVQKMKGFGAGLVFDGINLPVDRIFEGSRLANEAAMQVWAENPAQHVANSLRDFLRLNPLDQLLNENDPFNVERDELLEALTSNFTGQRNVDLFWNQEGLQAAFEHTLQTLEQGSQAISDRNAAMSRFAMSVDQFAGAQAAFSRKGKIELPPNPTYEHIAFRLEQERQRIANARTKGDVVARRNRDFVNAFRKKGTLDPDTGAVVANLSALNAIRKTLNNKLSNTHREMLNAALSALEGQDYTVVFGTPEMVSHWENIHFPSEQLDNDGNFYGKIDVTNKVIYLTNPSAETLAHELIHAATVQKMQGYYNDPKSVNKTDGEAIQRLEALMRQWLAQSYENEGPAVQDAHRMAISTVMGYLNQGKTAEAVNEFIAWSLTNQNLIRIMKRTQVTNPLLRIMGKALTALKRLVWGHKKAPQIGTDMFSQVRFNARVLMATPTPKELLAKDIGESVIFQSPSFGSSERLSRLKKTFGEQLLAAINWKESRDPRVNITQAKIRYAEALNVLGDHAMVAHRMAGPFGFNMQEMSTFKWIGATLAIADHLNTAPLDRIQEIYDQVIEKITPQHFETGKGAPEQDQYLALQKYNALTGVGTSYTDPKGRSNHLTNFIALAMVSEQFRDILRGMTFPKKVMGRDWSMDALVEQLGESAAASLAVYASGEGRNSPNFLAAMDALVNNITANIEDQRSFIEQETDRAFDKLDNHIKSYIEDKAPKIAKWAETVRNPLGQKAARYLAMLSRQMTEDGAKRLALGRVHFMNDESHRTTLREVVNEIIGRTEENAPVFDMITRIRTFVDQTRQRWREEFPREIKGWFKTPVSAEDWADLHHGIGRTDAGVLFASYRLKGALELLSSGSRRQAEIKRLEQGLSPQVIDKAKQLANYMVTGQHGIMLQPNAHAIAVLNRVPEREGDIDALVTLYALEQQPQRIRDRITELIQKDEEGFTKLYSTLVQTRNDEYAKSENALGRMNALKGHLEGMNQEGVHLVIADRSEHAHYVGMGYQVIADYQGSSADQGTSRKSYYFAPVSGRAKFNRGTLQTTHSSQFGIDPETGFSVGALIAGRITHPSYVNAIERRIKNQTPTEENLRPIYNEDGKVIAFERMADPKVLAYLNPSYDLAAALGAWRGRQTEEMAAKKVNREMVNRVYKIWEEGKKQLHHNQFVRVDTSKDPVIADAWSIMPQDIKDYIKEVYGDTGFMVRRDMVNDVIGARSATIGDFWTGNSRWNPEIQKGIRDLLMGFLGNKGYRILVNAESFIQDTITDAKILIVIKSVVVPAINFLSNIRQLISVGVPIRHIFSGMKTKTAELNSYIKRKERERQLESELFVAQGQNDSVKIRKLTARIQALQDSYTRLSIWPLLEAGEYNLITEGGISQEDILIAKDGYSKFIDNMMNRLPSGAKEIARQGLITRDTALFKMLTRATQYGDFLAKAVLYDDLIRRKKMNQQEALAFINEEFVNYNRFPGRTRAYLDSMGLTWFYHFKLRSMKVAARSIQRNPFRALLWNSLFPRIPFTGSIGSSMTDNMVSVIFDGRLGYTTGPGMLIRAPELNPWYALVD